MVWVKSEYAEELAVLFVWLSVLLPWSITVALGSVAGGSFVEFHFSAGLVRYLFGISAGQAFLLLLPWDAASYYAGAPGSLPFLVWSVATVVLALALLGSLALYFEVERFARGPFDPVRVLGALLALAALLLSLSNWVLQFGTWPVRDSLSFPGATVPVGLVIMWVFAVVLLRVERVEEGSSSGVDESGDEHVAADE